MSSVTANAIYRDLELCDLQRLQLINYKLLDSLHMREIEQLEVKIDLQGDYIKRNNRWYRKKELWGAVGFVVGVLVVGR